MKVPCLRQVGCKAKKEGSRLLFRTTMHGPEYEYRRCGRCGLIYHLPEPTERELREHYTDYGTYADEANVQRQVDARRERYAWLARLLARYLPGEARRMLDVGCAGGVVLRHFLDSGYDAYGVEVDPGSASIAGTLVGPNRVFVGTLGESPFLSCGFGLVFCEQTIEHVPNPYQLLAQINQALKDRGILFISTPNFGGPSFRLLKDRWKNTMPGDHISMFTAAVLQRFLELAGFTVIDKQVEGFAFNNRRRGLEEYRAYDQAWVQSLFRSLGEQLKRLGLGDGLTFVCRKTRGETLA